MNLEKSVVAECSGISPEMALRLGALLGNGAQLWVDMQTKYDLGQAETKLHDVLQRMQRITVDLQLLDDPDLWRAAKCQNQTVEIAAYACCSAIPAAR